MNTIKLLTLAGALVALPMVQLVAVDTTGSSSDKVQTTTAEKEKVVTPHKDVVPVHKDKVDDHADK